MRNNQKVTVLVASIILLTTQNLLAAPKPMVYILPHEIIGKESFQNVDQNFFGGQEVQLPFILNFANDAEAKLHVQSTQLTATLGAPYDLHAEILPFTLTERVPTFTRILSLKLPAVQRETEFELKFQIVKEKAMVDAGKLNIYVYPHDILEPLKAWSKKVQLRLCDRQGEFSAFLKKNEIEFVDSSAAKPLKEGTKVVTLWICEPTIIADPPPMSPGETFILVKEKTSLFPKVTVREEKQMKFITVDFNFLNGIDTDPVKQKMLVEIMQMANE